MFSFYIEVTSNCQRQIDIAINIVFSHHFFPIFISNTDVRYRYAKGKPRAFHDGTSSLIYRHRNMNGMKCGSIPYRNIQQVLYI